MKKLEEMFMYTHQGDEEHNCAYEIPFDSIEKAREHMNQEKKKGYICWGLKQVSRNYTFNGRRDYENNN
jgi:hypothetical protein